MKNSKRPFNLAIRAQDNGRYEIAIRGIIGEYVDYNTWTVKDTEEDVLNELKNIPEDAGIDCRINSRGGDVGLGLGIYNALSRRKEKVTTYNDGYAISAASIVMLAGSKRVSPAASIWMIHRAEGGVDGTGADMRTMADGMDVIDGMMAAVYASVSGKKSQEEFLALMTATTWCDGAKAVELGLATDCTGDLPADEGEEITDAEKKIIAAFDPQTIPENLRARVLAKAPAVCASLPGPAALPARPPAAPNNQPNKKSMNKLTAALVAAGYACATDATEDTVLVHINALISDRALLKTQVTSHEAALKTRVTAKVDRAITDKLIKAERKETLIKAGVADETMLDFVDDLRAEAAVKQARGATPARRTGEEEDDDLETQIEANEAIIENRRTDVSKRAETIRANLKLRGLDTIARKPAAAAAN